MAQSDTVTAELKPAQAVPSMLGVALVRGRIVGKPRTYRDRAGALRFATVLRLPNPDEFTTLGTVEVDSPERLGDDGDTWAGRVRLSGNVRGFQYTDKESGERKEGREFTAKLSVLL